MTQPSELTQPLRGKVVAVTGAGRGIGRGIALRLASEGAHVVVADYGGSVDGLENAAEDVAQSVVNEITAAGGHAVASTADVSSTEGGQQIADTATTAFGRLDGLVCCAGILVNGGLLDIELNDWERALAVHLTGHYACARAAVPIMQEQGSGRIVSFSSSTALAGSADRLAYATAKAGVIGFTLSLAEELAPFGITSNCIVPTGATRMHDVVAISESALTPGDPLPSERALGRALDPVNVAPIVAYLLTDAAADVNGQVFGTVGRRIHLLNRRKWTATISSDKPWTLEALTERVPQELGPDLKHHLVPWPER